jgi:hypothetical protein
MPAVQSFDLSAPYTVSPEDVEYARPNGEPLLARLYRPAGTGPFAALVDLHGGAWSYFDRTVDGSLVSPRPRRSGVARLPPGSRHHIRRPSPTLAGVRWVSSTPTPCPVRADAVGLISSSSGDTSPASPRFDRTRALATTPSRPDRRRIDARATFALALWPIAYPLARYRFYRPHRHPQPAGTSSSSERLRDAHDGFFGDESRMAEAACRACSPPAR